MLRKLSLLVLLGLALSGIACRRAPREEDIPVKASNDPLHQPRAILQRYAEGQPLGSEVTSFPFLVTEVRKTDPQRADVLERGLAEIQKVPPASRPARAKALLQALAPRQK